MADGTDLFAVLAWLAAGPGALMVAGAAVAFLLEIIPGWGKKIPGAVKPWIVLALAIGLAFGSKALLGFPVYVEMFAEYWAIIFLIVSAWLGTQLAFGKIESNNMKASRF